MNIIGIIGAMDEEVDILKHHMDIREARTIAGLDFHSGRINDREVVLVRCGIGKVNAAMCAQILISTYNVCSIINTGVAGALNDGLDVLDIVVSDDAVEHDFDATGFGYKMGEIPRMEKSVFEADAKLVQAAMEAGAESSKEHKTLKGRIATGDIFVNSAQIKGRIVSLFNGYCAEMEGAAIGHVCSLNKVPFVIIRAMSDKADGTAQMNYNEFVEVAANNSKDIVLGMLNKI